MNVHFFVTFSQDARNSVFARELEKQKFDYQIFSEQISLRYKHRIWLYFIGWPRMLVYSMRQSLKSLNSDPYPNWIVVGSHFEVLAITIASIILKKQKPKIMLLGFIYTSRKSKIKSRLKYFYFFNILKNVECVVCHSVHEVERNLRLFHFERKLFEYIPYGLHLAVPEDLLNDYQGTPYAVSAGRSGRDYDLLIHCFSQLGYPLHIVCDNDSAIKNKSVPGNIKILKDCYGDDYIRELAYSKIVIIPISVEDISAGQMVLLQSMALRKPIIITKTNTTVDYVKDMENALLVDKGNKEQMIGAIKDLWSNSSLANKLSGNALDSFETNYSMSSYVRNISRLLTNI